MHKKNVESKRTSPEIIAFISHDNLGKLPFAEEDHVTGSKA